MKTADFLVFTFIFTLFSNRSSNAHGENEGIHRFPHSPKCFLLHAAVWVLPLFPPQVGVFRKAIQWHTFCLNGPCHCQWPFLSRLDLLDTEGRRHSSFIPHWTPMNCIIFTHSSSFTSQSHPIPFEHSFQLLFPTFPCGNSLIYNVQFPLNPKFCLFNKNWCRLSNSFNSLSQYSRTSSQASSTVRKISSSCSR